MNVATRLCPTALVALAALAFGTRPAVAAIIVYTDRAAWTAALNGVVVENVNTVPAGGINFGTVGATATFGTHTFTRVVSPLNGSGGSMSFTADGTNARNIDGTPFLTWSGTTSSQPFARVDVPTAFGVGVDYNVASPSTDSDNRPHNSFYFDVTGNSGRLANGGRIGAGFLVNDETLYGVGNVPLTGFFGVIDDQGGITSYLVGSVWTNFQTFGVDNFSYATALSAPAGGGLSAPAPVPEPGTLLVLVVLGVTAASASSAFRNRRSAPGRASCG